jgi:hypothetical protein
MSWTRSIVLFVAVNLLAIGLMVLPYYLALEENTEIASVEAPSD